MQHRSRAFLQLTDLQCVTKQWNGRSSNLVFISHIYSLPWRAKVREMRRRSFLYFLFRPKFRIQERSESFECKKLQSSRDLESSRGKLVKVIHWEKLEARETSALKCDKCSPLPPSIVAREGLRRWWWIHSCPLARCKKETKKPQSWLVSRICKIYLLLEDPPHTDCRERIEWDMKIEWNIAETNCHHARYNKELTARTFRVVRWLIRSSQVYFDSFIIIYTRNHNHRLQDLRHYEDSWSVMKDSWSMMKR